MISELSKKDKLLYDLIFSNENYHIIDISDYITELYKYDKFIENIKEILDESNVQIVKESVSLDISNVRWIIHTKK